MDVCEGKAEWSGRVIAGKQLGSKGVKSSGFRVAGNYLGMV